MHYFTLLSGNADSKDHGTRVFFFSAHLLPFHYYSHYEYEAHYEHEAQVPSMNRKWLKENLELNIVRRGGQQHETGSAGKKLIIR